MGHLSLSSLPLDAALRYFLSLFKLPGEAQQIDRILQAFADRWAEGSAGGSAGGSVSGSDVVDGNVAFILSFALIMLNTDLHNPQARHKTSFECLIHYHQP